MKISRKHINQFEKLLTSQMQVSYPWVAYIHMEHELPDMSKNRVRDLITYTVEFYESDIPPFNEQMDLFKRIGDFHNDLGLDSFYTTSSKTLTGGVTNFPITLRESMSRKENYIDYIFNDLIENHIEIAYGERMGNKKYPVGYRLPGVCYVDEDDYHYPKFLLNVFNRDEDWDKEDADDFFDFLEVNYGMTEELKPLLSKRLSKWAMGIVDSKENLMEGVNDRVDTYYNHITNDVINNMVQDDVMDHIFILGDERMNVCNMWCMDNYNFFVERYGIRDIDFQYIVKRLQDYLSKEYPNVCNG